MMEGPHSPYSLLIHREARMELPILNGYSPSERAMLLLFIVLGARM